MNTREFEKGAVIFRQGDYAEVMYEILSGSVGIFTSYGTEYQKELTILREGQLLGEMGVIEAYPRSATAVAMEETKLQEISEKEFSDYFFEQPERVLLIMRQISQRLRERTEDYQKALDTLDEMKNTRETPDKRSKSLLGRIRDYFELYNQLASAGYMSSYEGIDPNYPYNLY